MLHRLFRLAAARPQLLVEHAVAYSELLAEELKLTTTTLKRQLTLQLIGLACLAVAVVLAGVAVMLWASLPAGTLRMPWLLIVVPVLPAALGGVAIAMGKTAGSGALFAALREQLALDAAIFNRSGEL